MLSRENATATTGLARVRALLVLLPVLALLGALAPSAALAQSEGGACTATLEQNASDETSADFEVDCGEENISTAGIRIVVEENPSNIEDGEDTDCTENSSRSFDCEPTGESARVSGALVNANNQDVCAEPALTVDFEIALESGETENIEDVEVSGCSSGGGSGSGSNDEDNGSVPEGGVDSGGGGTEAGESSLPAAGLALALALASVLTVLAVRGARAGSR